MSLTVGLTSITAVNAQAATTYETSSERGVKLLAWSKSYLMWTTNGSTISKSEADQNQSGLFINNKGYSKKETLSSSTKHVYDYKNEFLAGAELGGVKIGFSQTITDRGWGTAAGKSDWEFDK
ncbi:hypothetical protein LAV73_21355 [Lysinibacillus xylanilyticus]|uniref:hypothetical protein n=1 Tax=Lysinibacillus xylanilyticus TaxID=582475 RepID=UPI002B254C4C|nr:hypothetical protein [Lysinibacillus xylanilyticus]MEB2282496.1 hypothetical protein [Lysinibacillus xylanilyticus]